MNEKLVGAVGALALVVAIGVSAVGGVSAQNSTPVAPVAPAAIAPLGQGPWGPDGGMGFLGGSVAAFDAEAGALNLTPVQLFEQLHSGKTLSEIATAQNVDLTKVQEAVKSVQTQAEKDRISQAVKDGTMTQAQADWMLEGIAKGYTHGGRGFGPMGGHGGRGGMGGPGPRGGVAPGAPATPSTGTQN